MTEVVCEGEGCPDDSTSSGAGSGSSTEVTSQVYCPFRDELTVSSDGTVMVSTAPSQYADGNYNQITLVGGCVSGLSQIAARGYTPSICCDDVVTQIPGTELALDPNACNLSSVSGGLLMTSVNFESSGAYTVTGCGSTADPFKIQGPTVGEQSLTTTPCLNSTSVTVSGAGTSTNPLKVCHKTGALGAGIYDGIEIDADGHIVAIDLASSDAKTYVSDDFQISATGNTNECSINKKAVTSAGTAEYGGFSISYNEFGDITDITAPTTTPLDVTIEYQKPDNTTGTLTFSAGALTGQS